MTSDMILGMYFLLSKDVVINLNVQTINIDGKYYELTQKNTEDNEMKVLVRKTKINAIAESEEVYSDKIKNLIKEQKINNKDIDTIRNSSHEIKLITETVLDLPSYRILPKIKVLVKKEIEYLLKNKIIRKSNSKFGFPAFTMIKKNGKIALLIDYRKLNEITVKKITYFHKYKTYSHHCQADVFFMQ
ncbi:Retrovirus-related Pol polyprotein from transposon [Dictyocoela muelleri]|nr:Retrovirus-related Pol polyprotein from transposon [Dictyocoela muelleri]